MRKPRREIETPSAIAECNKRVAVAVVVVVTVLVVLSGEVAVV